MSLSTTKETNTLAIALGSNLPSPAGYPESTLISVRPALEIEICDWLSSSFSKRIVLEKDSRDIRWRWSPLFETDPIGGPSNQGVYINAVLVVDGPILSTLKPNEKAAINLLERFLKIEKDYGRDRQNSNIPWGPRSLDIDLLAWGGLHVQSELLYLPHPRLIERNFVIVPLGEALNIGCKAPRRIESQLGWQE